jgi:hypothetical protein
VRRFGQCDALYTVAAPLPSTNFRATGSSVPPWYGCEPCWRTQNPIVYARPGSIRSGSGSSVVTAQFPAIAGAPLTRTAPSAAASTTATRVAILIVITR